MSVSRNLGSGACLALAVALSVTPANAQGRGNCEDYAREATELGQRAEQLNCGFDGPRWNDNSQGHFAWCLISPRQAFEENEVRRDLLQKCEHRTDRQERREERREERRDDRRSERGGKRANCDTYSQIAQVQADANQKYNCGYRGGEWVTDSRAHYSWCMSNKRNVVLDELRYRAVELQKCFNTLGDYDEDGGDSNYQRRRFDEPITK
jgi:hypothetical protein